VGAVSTCTPSSDEAALVVPICDVSELARTDPLDWSATRTVARMLTLAEVTSTDTSSIGTPAASANLDCKLVRSAGP